MISRESIDERLQALSDVQNALWKSAEELLKLKSLLPASTASFGHSSSSSPIGVRVQAVSAANNQDRETESESNRSEDD
jgi:hypothetical protein